MKKRICSVISMIVSILLMASPRGVPLTFAISPTERVRKYYSYFSLTPLGYANWFPLLTALLSVIAVALLLIGAKRDLKIPVVSCVGAAMGATLLSWFVFDAFSWISAAVFLLHALTLWMALSQKGIAQ